MSTWILFNNQKLSHIESNYMYSCVFNTSHTALGDMPNFYHKLVCSTKHAIPIDQRPGWNTDHTNFLLMRQ